MKTGIFIRVTLLSIISILTALQASALDYPHSAVNNIGCDSCHFIYGTEPGLLPPWTSHVPQDIDDTQFNTICWSCHNDIDAPYVRTHSSLQIDNDYGDWTVECRVCHNPHYQKQKDHGSEGYVYSGTSMSVTATALTESGAGWTTDEYKDMVVIPNVTEDKYVYKIAGNTSETLTIEGPVDVTKAGAGDTFAIIYGKLINQYIDLSEITVTPSKSGSKIVRFFRETGANSFADGNGTYDGVCEVCHTMTTHFRNDGMGGDQDHTNMGAGIPGSKCTNCHKHVNGFRGMGGGAHSTHVIDDNGPQSECYDCHENGNIPYFKSGTDGNGDGMYNLAETDICDNCHSLDGVATAKSYWLDDPGAWVAAEGEAGFCGNCHDETPGNSGAGGSGDDAPNIIGDNVTYGFFQTGHGRETGSYAKLSWQDSTATGNPAANQSCGACHDLTSVHFDNAANRLKAGYENDTNNSNCKQCHDPGVSAVEDPAWYTTYSDYANSAHGAAIGNLKCSECHNVHGAGGAYPAMTKENQETLCYQCHTEGVVQNFGVSGYEGSHNGGYNQSGLTDTTANFPTTNVNLVGWKVYNTTDGSSGTITSHDATQITATLSGGTENDWDNGDKYHITYVDDIQQAFGMSEKHDLGTSFSRGGLNYTLECVTCHNVHIVTGKHWNAEKGLSPVSRVVDNTSVWGDEAGEKMDDFAALGSGTGGWYFRTAQGYAAGATGLPYDQPAVYRAPKAGSGYRSEFSGNVLPDYATFCLDCHSSRMSAANPPINWGQGIGCTDNSVDPPDQRIECGADHGLGAAGKPLFVSDSGKAGFWGASGNPDVLFDMNYVTRGRHNGHFMRWPYDSADRGAGINFVMSCTDCHEAHGASASSMLRPAVNNYTPGTGNWNTFCNGCHYYYGGQHAGMSCATASCHEAVSIHRIIHTGDSGAGTQLMLTASGYENSYQKPDFTPEITSAAGHIGSDTLTVTFNDGVWSNMDLSGALDADDFWLFDTNGNNPRTITNVSHTSGSSIAILTMSSPLAAADLSSDILAMKPASVWNWYEGGYNNAATGIIEAQAVSGGPWPVTIIGPVPVQITAVEGIAGYDKLHVQFSEGVYTTPGATGSLDHFDFILTDNDDGRTILSVNHLAGDDTAILTISGPLDASNDIGIDEVAAIDSAIFDAYDTAVSTTPVTVTALSSLPSISSVEGYTGGTELQVTFSDFVFSNSDGTGALAPSDFIITDTDDSRTIASVTHTAGAPSAVLTLSAALDSVSDIGVDTLAASGAAIFNPAGYPADSSVAVTIAGQSAPSIVAVSGSVGYNKIEVRFDQAVYADTGQTGSLQPGDFILTDNDNGRTILSVEHTPGVELAGAGEDVALLTLSTALDITDDINVDTVAANGIYNYMDNPVDTAPVTISGMPATVITSVEGVAGSNKLKVTFKHWVYANPDKTGALGAGDFVLTDVNGDNSRSITAVRHNGGDAVAILTMSETLTGADVDTDTVAAAQAAIFNSYAHPVDTAAVMITAQAAPSITSVQGTVGLDRILVFFSEGVYTNTGQSGGLQTTDFVLADADNSRSITVIDHTAGSASAILTLSAALDSSDDIGVDTVAAAGSAIYNGLDSAVGSGTVTITGNNCPVAGARFDFNEAAGSAAVADNSGLLTGTVGVPSYSMLGDGLFTGDETEAVTTYVDVANTNLCLKSPRALTLESRFYMGDVDLDYADVIPINGIDDDYDIGSVTGDVNSRAGDGRNSTFNRLAERKRTFLFTIMRASYAGDYAQARNEKARVQIKYRVTDRGYCDGTYPGDPNTIGDGAWNKQINSDIDTYPIVSGHWYKVRVVINIDKPRNVIDIFADDQGTDGSDTGELWAGYENITAPDPESSSSCKWAAIPGVEMATEDQYLYIGDNPSHTDIQGQYNNSVFKGKIDWFIWKPVVDYSGVSAY